MTASKKKSECGGAQKSATSQAKKPTPTKPDEMSEDLIEFITAIDEYKRVHSRPFPSWGEVFDVLKSLGYERPEDVA
jgi:hypothetical protein